MNVTQYKLNQDQYYVETHPKKQIYLHHTAGASNPYSTIDWWRQDAGKIATSAVIAGKPLDKNSKYTDGEIFEVFDSKYWAYHLGIKQAVFAAHGVPYQSLDKISIGLEICNWGQLTHSDKGWVSYVNTIIPDSEVVEYQVPHRGYTHYQKYTPAQIQSVHDLLVKWNVEHGIPIKYNGDSIFDVSVGALKGAAGVYTHCSVRPDKNDIHPQPDMIAMLKSL